MQAEVKNNFVEKANTDFEVRSLDSVCINTSELKHPWWYNLKYTAAGIIFGIILVKTEVILVVPHTGNVSIPEFSYVWGDWFCCSNRDYFCVADKKV